MFSFLILSWSFLVKISASSALPPPAQPPLSLLVLASPNHTSQQVSLLSCKHSLDLLLLLLLQIIPPHSSPLTPPYLHSFLYFSLVYLNYSTLNTSTPCSFTFPHLSLIHIFCLTSNLIPLLSRAYPHLCRAFLLAPYSNYRSQSCLGTSSLSKTTALISTASLSITMPTKTGSEPTDPSTGNHPRDLCELVVITARPTC